VAPSTRGWFLIGVAVSAIPVTWFDDTRVGTFFLALWTVFGAGLIVSLVLEEGASDRQLRRWLVRNRDSVNPVLEQVISYVRLLLYYGPLPAELNNQIMPMMGRDLSERKKSIQAGQQLLNDISLGRSDNDQWSGGRAIDDVTDAVRIYNRQIQTVRERYSSSLTEMGELNSALERLQASCKVADLWLTSKLDTPPKARALMDIAQTGLVACWLCCKAIAEAEGRDWDKV
jgi:hypothetical protein